MARINGFTDGIFAITITLLLFELKAPAEEVVRADGLWGALWNERLTFLTLAITFAVLGIYWVGHAGMFQLVHRNDRGLLWHNLLFLFFVGLIPFSAVMLTHYVDAPSGADQFAALTVYSANLALAGVSLDLLWRHASRGKRLIDPGIHEHVVWMVHVRVLAGAAVYLLAILIGWLVGVKVALYFLVVTPILYIFPFAFDRIEEWHVRRHPHG
jgi:uncharacterized membrane protein